MKDKNGNILTSEDSVLKRWKEYFEGLMNGEDEGERRPVEAWKCLGERAGGFLRRMFNKFVEGEEMEDDVQSCYNYRRIKLISHNMKRDRKNCVFVDSEKACDRVPREEVWYCMRKSEVADKCVGAVQDMYAGSETEVKCAVGVTEGFKAEDYIKVRR
ncbi:uncharacterized protein LOC119577470 [Penaeus monodon]|uniref:uncharacterized protein LOC119577470 n=1 Tax=Penaeus monodon TaxID=6687 RepID=UPI0018A763D2|nr:uncharacterized protein LOC119577470 [Penaeus monodon]